MRVVDHTYFLGVATVDMVLAGKGTVSASETGGHWGTGKARLVYGQVVDVDTVGGAWTTLLRRVFAQRGSRKVLVVPWDYDPACQPSYWSASARWIESGPVGFYVARMRPEPMWVNGMPTFDTFNAASEPYPIAPLFREGYYGTDALWKSPSLTPAEFMSLHAALPEWNSKVPHRDPSGGSLDAWVAAHPELKDRYPAAAILAMARLR